VNDELLRESLLELYEEAPCGYIFTRSDGVFLRVNNTFLDWTGYSRDEMLEGMRLQDILTVGGRIFYENQYQPLLHLQGFVREVAFDVVGKEGERLPVLLNSVVKPGDEPEVGVVASTLFLAADRRAYERELLQARLESEELASIVRMSSDAVLRCTAQGRVTTWNAGAQSMFGYTLQEAQGLTLSSLLPEITGARQEEIWNLLRTGESVRQDTLATGASGNQIDVSIALAPHIGPLGELHGISAIIRDISEIKGVERLQTDFLAMTSHELKTPLTSISGYAQFMRRRGEYNEAAVQAIMSGADHLGRLIDDLLAASRLDFDLLRLRSTEVDLTDVVRRAAAQVSAPDSIRIDVDTPERVVMVLGDSMRLGQVVTNLLTNAVKYSPGGTRVVAQVTSTDVEARVAIVDEGVGIPEDEMPHLFNRFYRVRSTSEVAQGIGLGLYIAGQIARVHGGSIAVASEVGKGSTFTLILPRTGIITRVTSADPG
jgi:PAS domain S-box-containing protein